MLFACCAVCLACAAISFSVCLYALAGVWKTYLRIRALETHLMEVEANLIRLATTLERQISLRETLLPRPNRD